MRRLFLIICLLLQPFTAMAFDLFGVNINTTNRVAMREVIRNSGANVVREAGEDNWYDIYDMSATFKQSKRLFVGYDKATTRFAFAEYRLPYDYFKTMLRRLQAKYGEAKKQYGQFESDLKYIWVVDGINIELQQNWHQNHTRLLYSQPQNLLALKQAYQQSKLAAFNESLQTDEPYF